jgi:hypothetical protein
VSVRNEGHAYPSRLGCEEEVGQQRCPLIAVQQLSRRLRSEAEPNGLSSIDESRVALRARLLSGCDEVRKRANPPYRQKLNSGYATSSYWRTAGEVCRREDEPLLNENGRLQWQTLASMPVAQVAAVPHHDAA